MQPNLDDFGVLPLHDQAFDFLDDPEDCLTFDLNNERAPNGSNSSSSCLKSDKNAASGKDWMEALNDMHSLNAQVFDDCSGKDDLVNWILSEKDIYQTKTNSHHFAGIPSNSFIGSSNTLKARSTHLKQTNGAPTTQSKGHVGTFTRQSARKALGLANSQRPGEAQYHVPLSNNQGTNIDIDTHPSHDEPHNGSMQEFLLPSEINDEPPPMPPQPSISRGRRRTFNLPPEESFASTEDIPLPRVSGGNDDFAALPHNIGLNDTFTTSKSHSPIPLSTSTSSSSSSTTATFARPKMASRQNSDGEISIPAPALNNGYNSQHTFVKQSSPSRPPITSMYSIKMEPKMKDAQLQRHDEGSNDKGFANCDLSQRINYANISKTIRIKAVDARQLNGGN